jgi:hypothetical protein
MKHKIVSALVAVIFFVTVYANLGWHQLILFVAVEIIIAAAYNTFYLKSQKGYYWSAIRFAMLEASIALLALILPEGFRFIPLAICALLLYFSEFLIAEVSEQLLFIETLLIFFGFAMGIYAISFYFAPSSTIIIGTLFISSALAARCGFDPIPRSGREKMFYSLLIGLSVSEIGWGLLLLPLHFTALAVIAFNVFYVLWMLSYFHFHYNITFKKILFHISFSAALMIIALATTPLK